ncbi:hypothetical protein DPMN_047885 [Dreissena polymorpha]|uniref:Uncharacterized protein n=1 Tax=Dreissena polymorpha TaxID=45954 RepID=A0A9D4D9N9_DREPO|nr:hypothetical protein DPMN_047885 [Dreissena polymorpha]
MIRQKNVTSRVFNHKKTAPPPCGHVFLPIRTICELILDIYKTNLFTKFHDDWANNMTSLVKLHPGSQSIQLTGTIFELNSRIKETNVLTKFHENWAKNVTSRVFTCFHFKHVEKNAPPTGDHVFSPIWTIFSISSDISMNPMFLFNQKGKTAPPTGGQVFQWTGTNFKQNHHIIMANILTKFYENWAKNVSSRRKMPLPLAAMFFHRSGPFMNMSDINKTNVLTNFHDDWAKIVTSRVLTMENCHYIHIEKNAPSTGGHVFSPIWTIFELFRDINKTNVLTNFHDDWAKIVTSRVFTSFELDRDYIGTKLLTTFYEDRTRNMASRVFANKC